MLISKLKEEKTYESNASMIARETNLNLEEARMKIKGEKGEKNRALESMTSIIVELEETKVDMEMKNPIWVPL